MKRALYILGGAVLFGVTAYLLLGQFATWYAPSHIQSDEEISSVFLILLGIVIVSAITGGVAGRMLHQKHVKNLRN